MKIKSFLFVGLIIACSTLSKGGETENFFNIINKISNPGFETFMGILQEKTVGDAGSSYLPTTFGDWAGDNSQIVAKSNKIKPANGYFMLQFLNTGGTPAISTDHVSQVWQLVEVPGGATSGASLGASFNQVKSKHSSQFGVALLAFEGDPAAAPTLIKGGAQIAEKQRSILADKKPATWQGISTPLMELPATTDFLAAEIQAWSETGVNGNVDPTLNGHYADNVLLYFLKLPFDNN